MAAYKTCGVLLAVVLTGVSAGPALAQQAPTVEAVDLGGLPNGGRVSSAADINEAGVVVGYAQSPEGVLHAVRWDRDGTITDLGTGAGQSSLARFINERGEIAGTLAPLSGGTTHAARWDARGAVTDLGTLPGSPDSWVVGLNERGVVAGTSYARGADGRLVMHAVRWDRSGRIIDLGSGEKQSRASGINNAGTVIGDSHTDYGTHAVRWDSRGVMTVLDRLPGSQFSDAREINDSGVVMGGATTASGEYHAVRWDRQGRITDLGTLPGGTSSAAFGLGADGTVVGWSNGPTFSMHAVRWDRHGRIHDLGTLPTDPSSSGSDINRHGVIIGGAAYTSTWWDRQGRINQFIGLDGDTSPRVSAINDKGVVVGVSRDHATLWRLPR